VTAAALCADGSRSGGVAAAAGGWLANAGAGGCSASSARGWRMRMLFSGKSAQPTLWLAASES